MRLVAGGEILASEPRSNEVTVELVLDVMRDEGNRLTGSVRTSTEPGVHTFSGTLELMRVFEELVPAADRGADERATPPKSEERA